MNYTFLDLARDVLKTAKHPLTYGEVWAEGVEAGHAKKLNTQGATPWSTMGARLSSEILHNPDSKFLCVSKRPQRFILKSRESDFGEKSFHIESDKPRAVKKETYLEQDLHSLLAYFVHTSPNFMGEQQVYTKTIRHQKSRRNSLKEWLHPDMVGVYFPFGDLDQKVIELSKSLNSNSAQIFSFELKRSIDTSTYREYFFQTVSNSSWAHEGYLVAAEISPNDELHSELGRLTNAFGIGIIHLDLAEIDSSRVLFPAKNKNVLDWDTINKLCSDNKDFAGFIKRLNTDFGAGQVHQSEYDPILKDPVEYIRKTLKMKKAQ